MTAKPTEISVILLAAGASRRFGLNNKLLADIGGKPLVARAAACLCAADVAEVIAVVPQPPTGDAVIAALSEFPIRLVTNVEHAEGIAASIRHGVASAAIGHGLMIVPGDMPNLEPRLLADLVAAFRRHDGTRFAVPVNAAGEQRNPVIWPADLRDALLALRGDVGGKALLAAHRDRIATVQWYDARAFTDIDTEADLASLSTRS